MPDWQKSIPKNSSFKLRLKAIKLVVFDFDGVFTDNAVYVLQDGTEAVRCNRSDGWGLERLREIGVEMMILSTEENPVVSARAKKLQLPVRQNVEDKAGALEVIRKQKRLNWPEIAYVGNDINDLECLKKVGFPVIVHDAHPEIRLAGFYRTDSVGGNGAVREICDLIWSSRRSNG